MHIIHQEESPVLTANCFSRLLFTWIFPLFFKGAKKTLTLEDLYRVLPDDKSEALGNKVEDAWNAEVARCKEIEKDSGKRRKPSLKRVLRRLFGGRYMFYGIFAFYEECLLKIAQPICLGKLLDCFATPKTGGKMQCTEIEKYIYAGTIILLGMMYTSSDHPYTFAVQRLGMKIRLGLCSLVYRKALKLSKTAQEECDSGQIINFLSSDINKFDILLTYLHYLWVAPVQFAIVIVVLWLYLGMGLSCLCGVGLIVLFVPFQGCMGKVFGHLRAATAGRTDRRIFVMNEILNAIRVIKMYTWEEIFMNIIADARKREMAKLLKTANFRALNQSIYFVTSRVTLFLTLVAYYFIQQKKPDPSHVFVCMALYSNVQQVMTCYFPYAILSAAETQVTIKRFENFLFLKDRKVDPSNERKSSDNNPSEEHKSFVRVSNLFAKWTDDGEETVLKNVSVELKPGKTVAVIGPTGAGKGSLLQAILGELPAKSGTIDIQGQVVYAAQEPWVFSGSVRENILFGKEMDEDWYDRVVDACALTKDFQTLSYGDNTSVGERGNALSGGQKARVNLARAVYANADIYLLDDPLSAVDAEVGRHLIEECILGILKTKALILVTHQVQFLKPFNEIILLSHGSVHARGTYKEVLESNDHFTLIMQGKLDTVSVHSLKIGSSEQVNQEPSNSSIDFSSQQGDLSNFYPLSVRKMVHLSSNTEPEDQPDEFMKTGSLGMSVYRTYLGAGSSCLLIFIVIVLIFATQAVFTGSDVWLRYWIDNTLDKDLSPNYQIIIYSAIMSLLFFMGLIRTLIFFRMCMNSSKELHRKLFLRVIKAPMLFFETNPVGRIMNRFSKDILTVDEMPAVFFDSIEIFLQLLGVLAVTSIESPYIVLPAMCLLICFYGLRKFYFKSASSIKRLEGVARGPIFTHLSTTFDGLTTIRAFKAEQKFREKFDAYQDVHTSVWYLFLACSRTLGIYIDWISIVFVIAVIASFMFSSASSAVVGLAVTSALTLTSMCQWGVRQSAEVSNQMISVERITDYWKLDQEAEMDSDPDYKPPDNWPTNGQITFNNLSMKYSPTSDHLVLKNIDCVINAKEKIGIVGRTGAGKSSLISSLFRLAESCEGYIEIDGVETSLIGLRDLRKKISIIPQEPTLFHATLRRNLDPFEDYPDSDIWGVLQDVNLAEGLQENNLGLDFKISEGGSNFSVGQKQLICLGRAILKRNRILILDEATANVDPETDEIIQKAIREKFSTCTVLTIAHRLHTVMDSDRILVLDAGKLIEFDEPITLLSDANSSLSQLVQQTGKTESHNLMTIAKRAATKRKLEENKLTGIISSIQ